MTMLIIINKSSENVYIFIVNFCLEQKGVISELRFQDTPYNFSVLDKYFKEISAHEPTNSIYHTLHYFDGLLFGNTVTTDGVQHSCVF